MIQFSINGNSYKQVLQVCLKSTNEDGVIVNYMHKHAENIRNIYKWKFYCWLNSVFYDTDGNY